MYSESPRLPFRGYGGQLELETNSYTLQSIRVSCKASSNTRTKLLDLTSANLRFISECTVPCPANDEHG